MCTHQFLVMIYGFLILMIMPSIKMSSTVKPSAITHTLAFLHVGHISCSTNSTVQYVKSILVISAWLLGLDIESEESATVRGATVTAAETRVKDIGQIE